MADDADVARVLNLMPTDAAWSKSKISDQIDAGNSDATIMVAFWQNYAAQAVNFVSITEDGSSRDLRTIFDNAQRMITYWKGVLDEEQKPTVNEALRSRIAFHPITRV